MKLTQIQNNFTDIDPDQLLQFGMMYQIQMTDEIAQFIMQDKIKSQEKQQQTLSCKQNIQQNNIQQNINEYQQQYEYSNEKESQEPKLIDISIEEQPENQILQDYQQNIINDDISFSMSEDDERPDFTLVEQFLDDGIIKIDKAYREASYKQMLKLKGIAGCLQAILCELQNDIYQTLVNKKLDNQQYTKYTLQQLQFVDSDRLSQPNKCYLKLQESEGIDLRFTTLILFLTQPRNTQFYKCFFATSSERKFCKNNDKFSVDLISNFKKQDENDLCYILVSNSSSSYISQQLQFFINIYNNQLYKLQQYQRQNEENMIKSQTVSESCQELLIENVNQDQRYAIEMALKYFGTFVWQGTFGSGKSRAIQLLIECIRNQYPEDSVLLVTLTNVAVDNVLERLIESDEFDSYLIERIGPGTTSKLVQEIQTKAEYQSPDKMLIATTFASLQKISQKHFDYIIIDEASQMKVQDYSYLTYICSADTIVVAGDILQLPPISSVQAVSALRQLQEDPSIPVVSFWTQYRCNEYISSICNTLFYNSKLKDQGQTFITQQNSRIQAEPQNYFFVPPVVVFNLQNTLEQKINQSKTNEQEKLFCLMLIDYLTSTNQFSESEIGIITFYKAQQESIQQSLQNQQIQVDTVDSFQGQERSLIIICTTSNFESPFNNNANRINVAISRASQNKEAHNNFSLIIDYAQSQNWSFETFQQFLDLQKTLSRESQQTMMQQVSQLMNQSIKFNEWYKLNVDKKQDNNQITQLERLTNFPQQYNEMWVKTFITKHNIKAASMVDFLLKDQ